MLAIIVLYKLINKILYDTINLYFIAYISQI